MDKHERPYAALIPPLMALHLATKPDFVVMKENTTEVSDI